MTGLLVSNRFGNRVATRSSGWFARPYVVGRKPDRFVAWPNEPACCAAAHVRRSATFANVLGMAQAKGVTVEHTDDASKLGAAARRRDREALRALGAIGGRKSVEARAARKAQAVAAVVLDTAQAMREFLQRRAGEVETSQEAPSAKANAASRLVSALAELDGFAALARENQRLGAENAALRVQLATLGESGQSLAASIRAAMLGRTDDDGDTGTQPASPRANDVGNTTATVDEGQNDNDDSAPAQREVP